MFVLLVLFVSHVMARLLGLWQLLGYFSFFDGFPVNICEPYMSELCCCRAWRDKIGKFIRAWNLVAYVLLQIPKFVLRFNILEGSANSQASLVCRQPFSFNVTWQIENTRALYWITSNRSPWKAKLAYLQRSYSCRIKRGKMFLFVFEGHISLAMLRFSILGWCTPWRLCDFPKMGMMHCFRFKIWPSMRTIAPWPMASTNARWGRIGRTGWTHNTSDTSVVVLGGKWITHGQVLRKWSERLSEKVQKR